MFISDDLSIISIGANCITDNQILQIFPERKGGLFDFNTITPDALIQILRKYKECNNFDFICNPEMYEDVIVHDTSVAKHKYIHGFIYDHEHDLSSDPESFLSKKNRQVDNLLSATGKKMFIWSNIQTNLIMICDKHGLSTSDFYLTKKRYEDISKLIDSIFDGTCKFLVRERYCDPEILKNNYDNVIAIDIPENLTVGKENAYIDSPSWAGPPMILDGIINT